MQDTKYPFSIRPLTSEDGGGFIIEYPDLPGCMSDGNTIEEAIANGKDAVNGWIETCKKLGREIPMPSKQSAYSGKILTRIPKSLHEKLANRARLENVSINSLIQTFVAEGLGKNNSSEIHPSFSITKEKAFAPNIFINTELANVANSTGTNFADIKDFIQHTKH